MSIHLIKLCFINSIPRCNINDDNNESIFKKSSKGTKLSRLFSQLSMLFNNLGADGGLFVVIGKKIENKKNESRI